MNLKSGHPLSGSSCEHSRRRYIKPGNSCSGSRMSRRQQSDSDLEPDPLRTFTFTVKSTWINWLPTNV